MMNMKGGFELTLLREIKLVQMLDHPNVVKLKDVFHNKGLLYFAIEYGPVCLSDLIASKKVELSAGYIKCIMHQLLDGLAYLHSQNVIHRDIKSSNIVLTESGILKIIDFNSAVSHTSPD